MADVRAEGAAVSAGVRAAQRWGRRGAGRRRQDRCNVPSRGGTYGDEMGRIAFRGKRCWGNRKC